MVVAWLEHPHLGPAAAQAHFRRLAARRQHAFPRLEGEGRLLAKYLSMWKLASLFHYRTGDVSITTCFQ